MRSDDQEDLDWYFNWAIGDLGVKGVDMAAGGGGTSSCNPEEIRIERTLDNSARYRKIGDALKRCSVKSQSAIAGAFVRCPVPKALVRRPIQHLHAALFSEAMAAFLKAVGARGTARARVEWLVKAELPTSDMGVAVESLYTLRRSAWVEAEQAVDEALREFGRMRRAKR